MRDTITKALKCFLLSVLFPIHLSGHLLFIICAVVHLLLSSPNTSFSALTLFRKFYFVCLYVAWIQSEEAAYHLQKSQLVTNSPVFLFHKMVREGTKPADCPLMVLSKYIENSNDWKRVKGREERGALYGNQRIRCGSFLHLHDYHYECGSHPTSGGGHGSD